jgi:hypothetical protein
VRLVLRWAEPFRRVVGCRPRLALHREELHVLYQMHYQHLTTILILTGVWKRARSTAGNNGGGGAKPCAAPRLCMYWNISAILCATLGKDSFTILCRVSTNWHSAKAALPSVICGHSANYIFIFLFSPTKIFVVCSYTI